MFKAPHWGRRVGNSEGKGVLDRALLFGQSGDSAFKQGTKEGDPKVGSTMGFRSGGVGGWNAVP